MIPNEIKNKEHLEKYLESFKPKVSWEETVKNWKRSKRKIEFPK